MQGDNDYSLIHVVRHLKYFMEKIYGNYYLTLEYKFAKPNQSIQGNKKFEKILQKSHQNVIIMNANRQKKTRDYVHLKSMTYPEQFKWFKKNLQTLQKIYQFKTLKSQKIDLNTQGQKITYESQIKKWVYKSRKMLFKPNYQAVRNGKLFRIALFSQYKGNNQPKRKVIDILKTTIRKVFQKELYESAFDFQDFQDTSKLETIKQKSYNKPVQKKEEVKDPRDNRQAPLRFKSEETIQFGNGCSLVMSRVYQVINVKLYESILQNVKNKKNSSNEILGKAILSCMVKEVFQELQSELAYEVEFRFSSKFIKEFQDMDEQQIEEIMMKAGDIFVSLGKDPNEFSGEQIVKLLGQIQVK